MFEEEAEEYKDNTKIKDENTYIGFPNERISELQDFEGNYIDISERIIKAFKDGAEFGYNKANKWHYNGIPHDNKPYLCKVEQPTKYDESEYEILFFDDKDMSWFRWLTLWSGEEGNETARINRKVIAWKEIVPPRR